ncbi:MAG: hypothetical protein AB7J35_18270 [Dehalococcoidia bacterium]
MRTPLALSASVLLGIVVFAAAAAQPQLPATYYGSVTINGEPAPSGIEVRGFVNGIDCSQSPPGEHVVIREGGIAAYVLYVVHDSQRPGCATEKSIVTFTIDGVPAIQQAPWKVGPNRLDLSTGSASPIPLPSPTGTIGAVIGSAAAGTMQPSASSTLARPTGTPPTDDVHFDRTVTIGPESISSDDGGSSLLVVLGIVLGVLALAGGGAGLFLARRSRNAPPPPEA